MIYKLYNPEYRDATHRTRKAYRHLIILRNKLNLKQINFNKFIVEVEKVIFNEIPTNDLIYLNDGMKNGAYITILKLLTGKDEDINRLKVDLLTLY